MHQDGLYLSHGQEKHALVVVRQDNGHTLWLRDFVSTSAALDVLEEDVLSNHNLAAIRESLVGNKGFFTTEFIEPEDGFAACSFRRYVLSPEK